MNITLKEVKYFSECPKFYKYMKGIIRKAPDKHILISKKIIQKGYDVARNNGVKVEWRRIVSWVNKETFGDIKGLDDPAYEPTRQIAESVLKFLQQWYYQVYLPEEGVGYSNLELSKVYGNTTVFTKAPIIKVKEIPILSYVSGVAYTERQLYNDIEVRGTALFICNALESTKIQVEHYAIGSKGGYRLTQIDISSTDNNSVNKAIGDIVQSIQMGISYASITSKCSSCPFKARCKL